MGRSETDRRFCNVYSDPRAQVGLARPANRNQQNPPHTHRQRTARLLLRLEARGSLRLESSSFVRDSRTNDEGNVWIRQAKARIGGSGDERSEEAAWGAIREDRNRRGAADENTSTSEDHSSILAAWVATAPMRWKEAKRGDPDALRQTARNYLFGTGVPVDVLKVRLWLEAARLVEVDPAMKLPTIDPFWTSMEEELNEVLTAKERIRAGDNALGWVKGLRQAQLRSLR